MSKAKPLLTKTGLTTALSYTKKNIGIFLNQCDATPDNKGNVTVKFKTDAEGLRLAKKYKKLADNPYIQMNVTFLKV
jgi:hypothetical protein